MPPRSKPDFNPADCPRGAVHETKIGYLEVNVGNHANRLKDHDDDLADGREKFANFKGDLRVIKILLYVVALVALTGGLGVAGEKLLPLFGF